MLAAFFLGNISRDGMEIRTVFLDKWLPRRIPSDIYRYPGCRNHAESDKPVILAGGHWRYRNIIPNNLLFFVAGKSGYGIRYLHSRTMEIVNQYMSLWPHNQMQTLWTCIRPNSPIQPGWFPRYWHFSTELLPSHRYFVIWSVTGQWKILSRNCHFECCLIPRCNRNHSG